MIALLFPIFYFRETIDVPKMKSSFISMFDNLTYTSNGALTNEKSGSALLDFFYKAFDTSTDGKIVSLLDAAWKEDPQKALRLIFYVLDVREGKSCNTQALVCLVWLSDHHNKTLLHNLKFVPQFGCWKDLLRLAENRSNLLPNIVQQFSSQLKKDLSSGDNFVSLAAKWMPSARKSYDKKLGIYDKVAADLFPETENVNVRARRLRKDILVPLRKRLNITEVKMSANEWEYIKYESVPSICMKRNASHFQTHDNTRYKKYIADTIEGKTKINVSTLKPHQICESVMSGNVAEDVLTAQWRQLVKNVEKKGALKNCMAVVDVSGSMYRLPLHVAISMGLLIASVTAEPFRNRLITFSEKPTFFKLTEEDSLQAKIWSITNMNFGMNTDIIKVFDLILQRAKATKLNPNDMIKTLIILSDMQFDEAHNNNNTMFETIKKTYLDAGYPLPHLIFWNLNGDATCPVKSTDENVSLISGFATNILNSILDTCSAPTPMDLMNETIMKLRYDCLQIVD